MRDAILITDNTVELSNLRIYAEGVLKFGEITKTEMVHQIIGDGDTYISISKNNGLFELLQLEAQSKAKSEFDEFNIFSCLFFDFFNFKKLIASIPIEKNIVIDNDHGRLIGREELLSMTSYEEFIEFCQRKLIDGVSAVFMLCQMYYMSMKCASNLELKGDNIIHCQRN